MKRSVYFELRDVMSRDRWHLDEVLGVDDSFPLPTLGERVVPTAPLFTEVHSDGPELAFTLSTFGVPIATAHLARVVADLDPDGVQLLDVEIRGRGLGTILNVTRVVKCFDELRSDYRPWNLADGHPERAGEYWDVNRLVIDPGSVPPAAHIFRIERYLLPVIVSERMREAMLAAGCDGAEFAPIGLAPAEASG